MSRQSDNPMLEMYIFETSQQIDQIEGIMLNIEKEDSYDCECVNEIFRIMHTIKGSSAMMMFNSIAHLAHSIEDLFYYIRENELAEVNCSMLCDLVLDGVDFIKVEFEKIKGGIDPDGDPEYLIDRINEFLLCIKDKNPGIIDTDKPKPDKKQQYYISPEIKEDEESSNYYFANVQFEEGCEMENVRAYMIINNLKDISEKLIYFPEDVIEDKNAEYIREKGFSIYIKSNRSREELVNTINETLFLEDLAFEEIAEEEALEIFEKPKQIKLENEIRVPSILEMQDQSSDIESGEDKFRNAGHVTQSVISVNVSKLDQLMDLVGEIVIAEAMVTQNPDIKDLDLDNFEKAGRQLRKITNELRDIVMSIRMVPISTTFLKLHRIVRDVAKNQGKEVQLELLGEETEVDKNIIEHIGDPLIHLIRNAVDHGIEDVSDRMAKGKQATGKVIVEARNEGGDVLIIIKDDGKGLNREELIQKGIEKNLINKPVEELTDREVYSLIFNPGFSTKQEVTELSGRGVGMDVVVKNIEAIGGNTSIDSTQDKGTTITLRIPLTLAIIDGMNVSVGESRYTIPIMNIRESFRPIKEQLIIDPEGNEMIMVRGNCYPIFRIHKLYKIETSITDLTKGILVMVEQNDRMSCIFVDELIGQQPVVVKSLPNYIKNIRGIAGCTLLGDGNISLILDVHNIHYSDEN